MIPGSTRGTEGRAGTIGGPSSRQRLVLGVRLAVAVGGLAALFHFIPTDGLVSALTRLDPLWLASGFVMQYVMRAVATLRMKVIADSQGLRLSHITHGKVLLISQFYSMLLPGPIAGGGATWLKYVQHGADHATAGATIVLNRGVAFVVLVIVGAIAWFADTGRQTALLLAALPLVALFLLALLDARRFPVRPASTEHAGQPSGEPLPRRVIAELLRRLRLFGRIPRGGKLIVVSSSILYELVAAVTLWFFALAVGLELALLTVAWMRAALQLVLLLPITVAGLGLREASLVGLGALIGVPAATAMAWSLTIFLGSLVIAATGGLIEATGASNELRSARGGAD